MSDIPVGAQVPPSRAELTEVPNKPLVTSKVTDSAFEKVLLFSTDLELRDRYINFFGGLRLGKLLEVFGSDCRRSCLQTHRRLGTRYGQ